MAAIHVGDERFNKLLTEITLAIDRIPSYIRRTPLEYAFNLSARLNATHKTRASTSTGGEEKGGAEKELSDSETRVWLKLESEQVTGSFKARGAVNKILALTPEERARGIVTASTGNHALAVAHALRVIPGAAEIPAKIYLPKSVKPAKLDALKERGAPIHMVDASDCVESEMAALAAAKAENKVYISPYNDVHVIGGQGTIGWEILQQLPPDSCRPLAVLVPVGGGGMLTGIAVHVKSARPNALVIGVQPSENNCMIESIRKGHVAPPGEFADLSTWSDGTAGGIEDKAMTFDACRDAATTVSELVSIVSRKGLPDERSKAVIDAVLGVDEDDIKRGMMYMLEHHHKVVEGSAGTGIGWLLRHPDILVGFDVVVVCCGANISVAALKELLSSA